MWLFKILLLHTSRKVQSRSIWAQVFQVFFVSGFQFFSEISQDDWRILKLHFFTLSSWQVKSPNLQSAGADLVFRKPLRCYSEKSPVYMGPPKSDMLNRWKPGQAGSLRACAFPPTFAHFPTPKICHRLGSWIQMDPKSCPVGQSEFSLQ